MKMNNAFAENYLADAVFSFKNYKRMAERALNQLSDDEFFYQLDAESNSAALIIKHIAGNLRSRWTDFLTSDGEKPDRNRDEEFELFDQDRAALMQHWEDCWQTLFDSLATISPDNFDATVMIRGEPHAISEAVNRQLTHYAYHVGQIIFIAKHLRSEQWQTLSIPKGRSAKFNQMLADKQLKGVEKTNRFEVDDD